MSNRLTKTIIGAVVALALAAAVSYGVINQQTADQIQTQANQTLSNGQDAPPSTPQPPATAPNPNPQAPAPTPRQ